MSSPPRSLLIATAVYLGAVVLVGFPAIAFLSSAFGSALGVLGWERVLGSGGSLLVLVVSFFLGLQLAIEVAALQLGGVEALQRGSPRLTLVRHLGFAAIACIGLAFVTRLALSAALGGYGSVTVGLGLLVAITVLYRSSGAFLAGFRSDEQT